MRKRLLVMAVAAMLCCASLFANGGSEAVRPKDYASVGRIGRTIQGIGEAYGLATRSIVLAVHPFPNILAKFYGIDEDGNYVSNYDGVFSGDYLLTSEDFYANSGFTAAGTDDRTGQALVSFSGYDGKFAISETDSARGLLQHRRWSITTYLFIVFFAAEVVFTAVFGYIAPRDENASLLRQIGVSAAMTLMLFILAAAIPFLVEAVRYGLFKIASIYSPVGFDSLFDMPAKFMYDVSLLMETLSWNGDASPIFNENSAAMTSSVLGKLLAGVVYLVFEFVLGFQAIKAGLHIVMNVVEVYVLVSAVMVLLPISVFTPLKDVTRKCVYSLFSNLLECFVLCLIVVLVVPACINACDALNALREAASSTMSSSVELVAEETASFRDGDPVDVTWHMKFIAQGSDYVAVASWTASDSSGKVVMYNNDSALYKEQASGASATVKWTDANDWATVKPKDYAIAKMEDYFIAKARHILSRTRFVAVFGSDMGIVNGVCRAKLGSGVPVAEQEKVLFPSKDDCITRIKAFPVAVMDNRRATEADSTYAANETLVSDLLLSWLLLYLPCYFVLQSTQITNSLVSGSAGQESLSNAISQSMHSVMGGLTIAANVAKTGASMGASASSSMTQNQTAQTVQTIASIMQNANNSQN